MNPNSSDPNNPTPIQPAQDPTQQDLGSVQPEPMPPDKATTPASETPLPDLTTAAAQMSPPEFTPIPPVPDINYTPTPIEPGPSESMSTFTSSAPLDSNLPPTGTPLTPEQPSPAESIPTPTFTSPPPAPNESGSTGSSVNPSDFNAPAGSFNWPDNQYTSPGTNMNDALNMPGSPSFSQTEPAPSDLSHLVNSSEGTNLAGQEPILPLAQPESLVPGGGTNSETEIPSVPTEETHRSFPKWAIGVGVGLLLAVAGASAYFILGIGKTPLPESVPATGTQEETTAPPVIQPTAVPTIAIPTATPSAGVSLPGGSGTQATSAADLLRQRQGR